jgi:hypothetical protein
MTHEYKFDLNKCLLILIFIIISIIMIVIYSVPSSQGYEISIYSVYPIFFWILIIFLFIFSLFLSINQITNNNSFYWIIGYILIIFSNLLLLLLPFIRNYFTSSAIDVLLHTGLIKDILFNGHFGGAGTVNENIYPFSHVFMSEISLLTHIPPEKICFIAPLVFILLYTTSLFLLAKLISLKKEQILLITLFGSLLMFNYQSSQIFPSFDSFLFLPMVIYLDLMVRQKFKLQLKFGTILILFLLVLPVLHPGEGTILAIFALLGIEIMFLLYPIIKKNSYIYIENWNRQIFIKLCSHPFSFVFLSIFYYLWVNQYKTLSTIVTTISNVVNTEETSEFTGISSNLNHLNISYFEIIKPIIMNFGNILLFLGLASFLSLIYIIKILKQKKGINIYYLIFIYLFFIFNFITVVDFLFSLGSRGIQRMIVYPTFLASIINGLLIYNVVIQYKNIKYIIFLFLVICSIFAIFNTHQSPEIKLPNPQISSLEISGMMWFLSHQNDELNIESRGVSQMGLAYLLLKKTDIPNNIHQFSFIPNHFGYNSHSYYGESIQNDIYYLDDIKSRITSKEIYPEFEKIWNFNENDFLRMDSYDLSVNKLYSNKEFWVYYVNHINK